MKRITEHLVVGQENEPHLVIDAVDEPSNGGASHVYAIRSKQSADAKATTPLVVIDFQKGAVKDVGINGIQNVALIAIVLDQLRTFQAGPFKSNDNESAIFALEQALEALHRRTRDRIARGVEGQAKV